MYIKKIIKKRAVCTASLVLFALLQACDNYAGPEPKDHIRYSWKIDVREQYNALYCDNHCFMHPIYSVPGINDNRAGYEVGDILIPREGGRFVWAQPPETIVIGLLQNQRNAFCSTLTNEEITKYDLWELFQPPYHFPDNLCEDATFVPWD